MLPRCVPHNDQTDPHRKALADASVNLKFGAIKPLGDLLSTLPAGPEYPGRTAGPSFELFYESDYLMPHREAAWALLAERLEIAAGYCDDLCTGRGARIASELAPVMTALREIAATLEAHLPPGIPQAAPAARPEPADVTAVLARAAALVAAVPAAAP